MGFNGRESRDIHGILEFSPPFLDGFAANLLLRLGPVCFIVCVTLNLHIVLLPLSLFENVFFFLFFFFNQCGCNHIV